METTAVVIPVKPGKREALRRCVEALEGDRAAEEQSFNRQFGIWREVAWLQEIDGTDHVILYQEVEDPEKSRRALEEVMTSDEHFPRVGSGEPTEYLRPWRRPSPERREADGPSLLIVQR